MFKFLRRCHSRRETDWEILRLLMWILSWLPERLDATTFELESITNHHFTLKGNIMAITIDKSLPVVTGKLLPKAVDAQGNKVDGKLQDGSLVTYVVSDPTIASITPDPANPLGFKLTALLVGKTTWQATGVNPSGGAVVITEDLEVTDAGAPPAVPDATSFDVAYDAPVAL